MRKFTWIAVVVAVLMAGASAQARAAGGTVHIFMSELALERVQDPELKALLERNRNVALWASWYPDSGYQARNEYGEYSHWMPFLNGYRDYIKNDAGKNDPDYEFLVAHLLGASAHSIQDQLFDHIFLLNTAKIDGTGQAELDRGLDMVCMYDYERYKLALTDEFHGNFSRFTPVAHLEKVYQKLGMPYKNIRKQILRGQKHLALGISGEKIFFTIEQNDVRTRSPWAAANYYTAPGGVVFNAGVTAAYWEAIWDKLNGRPADFIIGSLPENGGRILSVDKTSVDSNIYVFFSGKYDNASINADTFVMRDAAGTAVPGKFHWGYNSNMMWFESDENLAAGSRYTVVLKKGIKDSEGAAMTEDYNFEFSTP